MPVESISRDALKQLMDKAESFALLDIREPGEYNSGHIPGAYWISRGWLEEKVPALFPNREQPIHVTCPNGVQSALAGATLVGSDTKTFQFFKTG